MAIRALLVSSVLFFIPLTAKAELKASIEESTLRVEGVTPGGDVALLSIWREQVLDGPHTHRTTIEETLSDDDSDGVVEFESETAIPPMSIWAFVDEETGERVVVTPEVFTAQAVTSGTLAGGKDAEFRGRNGVLQVRRTEVHVLVVRPKGGHWKGSVRDGKSRDTDNANNNLLSVKLDTLDPSEKADPLASALLPGDVVIAIDPYRMAVLNLQLQGGGN